jgi:hypothetical protein
MKLVKPDNKDKMSLIDHYQNKSSTEVRSIFPKWAAGSDKDKMLNKELDPIYLRYQIVSVNLKDLVKFSEFGEFDFNCLFTGQLLNDYRIANLLARWDNGLFVDPPSIYLDPNKVARIAYADGRHSGDFAEIDHPVSV